MQLKQIIKTTLLSVVIISLVACVDDTDDKDKVVTSPPFNLKVLHINDHHSHLEANSRMNLILGGEMTRVEMGGFPRVVSKIQSLENHNSNVLKLHAGDAISGSLYYTLFKGKADAAMMNEVCFDAYVLGNHEFNEGDAGLHRFLEYLYSPSCQTDVLAANVVPAVGVSPLSPDAETSYIKPYTIKELADGHKVGIIGLVISNKTKNSSSPDASTEFLDEFTTAQKYIDKLTAKGINKIILLTHYKFSNDMNLASQLTGVDIIVGGDSHSLLGNADNLSHLGLNSKGDYPSITTDASGGKVCVVQAWHYSYLVGELDVSFDQQGKVTACTGTPHLLLGDTFKRRDASGNRVELQDNERQSVLDQIANTAELSIVEPDPVAQRVLAGFSTQLEVMKNTVIGQATENLCLERIPGQGRSLLCDVTTTGSNGSDISNIVALAFKNQSLEADFAIQNGGGVRIDIAAGEITIGDAYLLLPFANTLVNMAMTGAEIKAVLEEAVDFALSSTGSTGAYPYASGIRFDVYSGNEFGSRIANIEVKRKNETLWTPLDSDANYTVVTNSFVAAGKDGYLTFGRITAEGRATNTYLDYAQAFVNYVKQIGVISKLPLTEYSTQRFYDANGNLL